MLPIDQVILCLKSSVNVCLQNLKVDVLQGRVVRKPVNTNPGLKVHRTINFSCLQLFSASYFLCSLRLLKFKSERQKYKQKTPPKSWKTQIKILVNPGLAQSGFEQLVFISRRFYEDREFVDLSPFLGSEIY